MSVDSEDCKREPNFPPTAPRDQLAFPIATCSSANSPIEVRCGYVKGNLHPTLFQCPGIHNPCIELNGEMITPKEFTMRAQKHRQKDWKGSIKINGRSLRFLMDTKKMDFYNHATMCTSRCVSRNRVYQNQDVTTAHLFIPIPSATLVPGSCYRSIEEIKMVRMPQHHESEVKPMPELCSEEADVENKADNLLTTQQPLPTSRLVDTMRSDPQSFLTELHQFGMLPQVLALLCTTISNVAPYIALDERNMSNVATPLVAALDAFDLAPTVAHLVQQQHQANLFIQQKHAIDESIRIQGGADSIELDDQPLFIKEEPDF